MSEQYQHTLDKAGKVHVHFDDDIPFEDGVVHLFKHCSYVTGSMRGKPC